MNLRLNTQNVYTCALCLCLCVLMYAYLKHTHTYRQFYTRNTYHITHTSLHHIHVLAFIRNSSQVGHSFDVRKREKERVNVTDREKEREEW